MEQMALVTEVEAGIWKGAVEPEGNRSLTELERRWDKAQQEDWSPEIADG